MTGRLVGAAVLAFVAVACTQFSSADESESRSASAVATALRWTMAKAPRTDPAESVVVFVSPLDETSVPLEVQVEVVDALRGVATVRFVDDVEEALHTDDKTGAEAVNDDGILVRLTAPEKSVSNNVTVPVDRWIRERTYAHNDLHLSFIDGRWNVEGAEDAVQVTVTLPEEDESATAPATT